MPQSTRNKERLTLLVVFVVVLVVTAFVVYYIGGARRVTPETIRESPQPDAVLAVPDHRGQPATPTTAGDSFIDRLFGSQHSGAYMSGASWAETMGRISLRLVFAALLG